MGQAGGSGPKAGWLGPPARGPLLTPGPLREHPARTGCAPGLSAARAWPVGEAPGRPSGGVSSRRCGVEGGPWASGLATGASRQCAAEHLPAGPGGVSGPQVGRRDPTPASRESGPSGLFIFACGFIAIVSVFSIKKDVPALPKASLDARLADAMFFFYLFLALLFLVLVFWRLASICITFLKNKFVLGRAK